MDPRFFLPCFHGPRASRLGHKRKEKNLVHNLPYGPRTRLIRGMYLPNTVLILALCVNASTMPAHDVRPEKNVSSSLNVLRDCRKIDLITLNVKLTLRGREGRVSDGTGICVKVKK